MNQPSPIARRLLFALLFLGVAAVCSVQRLGQRENEALRTISDSDFYLDMAHVFIGDARRFNPEYVKVGAHHYNRPLLPFFAGHLARLLPHHNLRAAFSLVDIFSITLAALLLMEGMRLWKPDTRIAWFPSLLLLSGFPQMNWGYHILADTLGLATAFISAGYAAWLVRQTDGPAPWPLPKWVASLTLLFAVSSIAFLSRETAWLAVITTGWLAYRRRGRPASVRIQCALILLALLLGKLPHAWYASHYQVYGVLFDPAARSLLNWRYLLDFAVKTGVCFNLSWLPAAAALWLRPRSRVPGFVTGWTIGSLLYMGAGYAANNLMSIGYPMRMSYALFPLVFYLVADFMERRVASSKLIPAAIGYWLVQAAINWAGVMLDPGKGKITVLDALNELEAFIGL